jgi:hypothetical protein
MSFLKGKSVWSLGEEGSKDVIARNVRALQALSEELETCCANPYCKYPLSSDREAHYAAPNFGELCEVCHAMYTSVSFMNPLLKNRPNYFKDLHEAYLKEIKESPRNRWRMDNL